MAADPVGLCLAWTIAAGAFASDLHDALVAWTVVDPAFPAPASRVAAAPAEYYLAWAIEEAYAEDSPVAAMVWNVVARESLVLALRVVAAPVAVGPWAPTRAIQAWVVLAAAANRAIQGAVPVAMVAVRFG